MEIIEYKSEYDEQIKDLLVELQEYLVEIDYWHFLVLKPEYREKMFKMDLEEIMNAEGKTFLATENGNVIGLVMGCIPHKDSEDKITNTCARNGKVMELVVKKGVRGLGVGKELLRRMETYFKEQNCENITIEVYGPNKNALSFYSRKGYEPIDYILIKQIKKD